VRRALLVLLPLLVVAAALAAGYAWSQNQYYVAADGPYVAIYRGVQLDVPGIDLSRSFEVAELRVDDLPTFDQEQIEEGIVADDLTHAQRIVDELVAQVAEEQPADEPTDQPTGGTGANPTAPPTDQPTDRPTDRPTGDATGRATASPRGAGGDR
jgi:protein phosphatase